MEDGDLERREQVVAEVTSVIPELHDDNEALRIYKQYNIHQNLTFRGLTKTEIFKIAHNLDSARAVAENWVSRIEEELHHYKNVGSNAELYSKFQAAEAWLKNEAVYPGEEGTDENAKAALKTKKEFLEEMNARLYLHDMRRSMGQADWQAIKGYATEMGMSNLALVFGKKNARVAFNTYQRFFERYLYNQGKVVKNDVQGVFKERISPQTINKVIVPEVQKELTKNFGLYGFKTEEEAIIAERIGYSLFTASQRRAVHSTKGNINSFKITDSTHPWFDVADFTSDPDEVIGNLYNVLFNLKKWHRLTPPQQKLFDHILNFMGEGNYKVGEKQFIEALSVSDLFSSGWRIDHMLQHITLRMEGAYLEKKTKGMTEEEKKKVKLTDEEKANIVTRAKTLATGLRLKRPNQEGDDTKNTLTLMARYRPFEIMKEYVVDIDDKGEKLEESERKRVLNQMFGANLFTTSSGHDIKNFVELEEILGDYIFPIYEQGLKGGWNELRGIDIGDPSDVKYIEKNPDGTLREVTDIDVIKEVVDTVNKRKEEKGSKEEKETILEVEDVQYLYRLVQDFSRESVPDLVTGKNFEHAQFFARTLYIDDVPIQFFETEEFDDKPLSLKLNESQGGGRDSYARIWNDTENGAHASEGYGAAMKAVDEETLFKGLSEGAQAMAQYAGAPAAAKFFDNILGGWIEAAKMYWHAETFSLDKLPGPSSKLQEWFGEYATAANREDRYKLLERVKTIFGDMSIGSTDEAYLKIHKRVQELAGVQHWKLNASRLTKVALIALFVILKGLFDQMQKDLSET